MAAQTKRGSCRHLVDHLLRGGQPASAHGRRLGSTPCRRRLRPPSRCNGRRGPPGRRSRPSSRARVRFLPLYRHESNVRCCWLRRGRPHCTDTTSHEAVTPRTSPAAERSVARPEPPFGLSAGFGVPAALAVVNVTSWNKGSVSLRWGCRTYAVRAPSTRHSAGVVLSSRTKKSASFRLVESFSLCGLPWEATVLRG